jgi:hypothetical protein
MDGVQKFNDPMFRRKAGQHQKDAANDGIGQVLPRERE